MILSPNVSPYNKRAICPNHICEMKTEPEILGYRHLSSYPIPINNHIRITSIRMNLTGGRGTSRLPCPVFSSGVPDGMIHQLSNSSEEDVDEETCPVDCVKEFKTDEEFLRILDKAKKHNTLVVVDFYRTSCGSCRYIEHGFVKLCKVSADHEDGIIFLKHNVIDEYDEPSEVADRLRIKKVPLFHFYKNGVLLEQFATRDKERIVAAITKYLSPSDAL